MKKKKMKMNKIDSIIKEAIDRFVLENTYATPNNKVLAAANAAYKKNGGATPRERYLDWLAKQAAIKDINADLASQRSKTKKGKIDRQYSGWGDDEEYEINDFNRLADNREKDFNDYYNSENDFYRPIYNDIFNM